MQLSGRRPAQHRLSNASKGHTVLQVGNILLVCAVISVVIISDQCHFCRERSPCAKPLPTLMADVTSAPGWKVPWASISPSICFCHLEQGHFQSHTGSKSEPKAASLAGSEDPWLRTGFLNLDIIDIQGWIIPCSVHCKMFNSILPSAH